MTLKNNPSVAITGENAWLAGAWDLELLDTPLGAGDYTPSSGMARGFIICTATGPIKIDTPAGSTVTIPSGLATGVMHAIPFTKMYSTAHGTTATGLIAIG